MLTGPASPQAWVYLEDVQAVTPGGRVSLLGGMAEEFEGQAGLDMTAVDGDAVVNLLFSELPADRVAPSAEVMRAHPLWRDGEILRITVPERTRAEAVPYLARSPERLPFVIDAESAQGAGLSVGDEALFGVDGEQVEGVVVGMVQLIPTDTDRRLEGAMLAPLDGVVQWVSGAPAWSISGTLAKWTQPQELWLRTGDANGAARRLAAELGAEPEALNTIAGVSSDFSSRPIQVGLVSILFIGTGAGVALTWPGSPPTC